MQSASFDDGFDFYKPARIPTASVTKSEIMKIGFCGFISAQVWGAITGIGYTVLLVALGALFSSMMMVSSSYGYYSHNPVLSLIPLALVVAELIAELIVILLFVALAIMGAAGTLASTWAAARTVIRKSNAGNVDVGMRGAFFRGFKGAAFGLIWIALGIFEIPAGIVVGICMMLFMPMVAMMLGSSGGYGYYSFNPLTLFLLLGVVVGVLVSIAVIISTIFMGLYSAIFGAIGSAIGSAFS